jgi:RimJ/RimL family protein N-acetyltransferase
MICKSCSFHTERLIVKEWHSLAPEEWEDQEAANFVMSLMTPGVTQSLPEAWQGEYTLKRAREWVHERDNESTTLLVIDRSSRMPIGLVILYEEDQDGGIRVRLGYMLMESMWGKGLASELIRGLVEWCRNAGVVSIVGGVNSANIASRRVLEKNGFEIQSDVRNSKEILYELRFLPG